MFITHISIFPITKQSSLFQKSHFSVLLQYFEFIGLTCGVQSGGKPFIKQKARKEERFLGNFKRKDFNFSTVIL